MLAHARGSISLPRSYGDGIIGEPKVNGSVVVANAIEAILQRFSLRLVIAGMLLTDLMYITATVQYSGLGIAGLGSLRDVEKTVAEEL